MFNSVKDRDVPQPPVVPGVSAPAAKGRYGGPPPIPVLPADGELSALAKIDAQREHMDGLNQW